MNIFMIAIRVLYFIPLSAWRSRGEGVGTMKTFEEYAWNIAPEEYGAAKAAWKVCRDACVAEYQTREAAAHEDLKDITDNARMLENTIGLLKTELAAAREMGPCGKHPKMFWTGCEKCEMGFSLDALGKHFNQLVPDIKNVSCEGHCTLCDQEAAAVAAALHTAADRCEDVAKQESIRTAGRPTSGEYEIGARFCSRSILALITPVAADALKRHDAALQRDCADWVLNWSDRTGIKVEESTIRQGLEKNRT